MFKRYATANAQDSFDSIGNYFVFALINKKFCSDIFEISNICDKVKTK